MTANGPAPPPRAPPTSPDPTRELKDALRRSALAARAGRSPDQRREDDARRLPRLLDACAGHEVVACYASSTDEPDTWALIEELDAGGVRVLLPVLRGHRAPAWGWFAGRDRLVTGWRGILEPEGAALPGEALLEASLVWASALLTTPQGVRLGRGGGWYDRALRHRSATARVGVLLADSEIVPDLPREPWDVLVDLLVSERRSVPVQRQPPEE